MSTPHTFTPGSARWLSSLGHPGYSPEFAARVWAFMVDMGAAANDHDAVWRAIDLARHTDLRDALLAPPAMSLSPR